MELTWTAPDERVHEAEQTLESAVRLWATANAEQRDDALGELLAAIGRLVVLDAKPRISLPAAPTADAIVAALYRESLQDALDDAAAEITDVVERLTVSEGDTDVVDVRATFAARDRAELESCGAEYWLQSAREERHTLAPVAQAFDEICRPHVWLLVSANRERRAALEHIAPHFRRRFWWWQDGAQFDHRAIAEAAKVATWVATYAGAREHFENLVRAASVWGNKQIVSQPQRTGNTLAQWLSRATPPLQLAAAEEAETTLLQDTRFELSFAGPNRLIVDLLADCKEGVAPRIHIGQGTGQDLVLTATAVVGAVQRYEFVLSEHALQQPDVRLELALVDEVVRVTLPSAGIDD